VLVVGKTYLIYENAAVGFDVLTTCQPSTVWCSRERLPAAAAQPAKARQSCSATDYYYQCTETSSQIIIKQGTADLHTLID
jgi:hypothetical protein